MWFWLKNICIHKKIAFTSQNLFYQRYLLINDDDAGIGCVVLIQRDTMIDLASATDRVPLSPVMTM